VVLASAVVTPVTIKANPMNANAKNKNIFLFILLPSLIKKDKKKLQALSYS
jgi:hypothetical protein